MYEVSGLPWARPPPLLLPRVGLAFSSMMLFRGTQLTLLLLALASSSASWLRAQHKAERSNGPAALRPLFAISDVHGDRVRLNEALMLGNLTDSLGVWRAGATTLVHTGDSLDRGPNTVGVVKLWRQLQRESAAAGGQVQMLLGDHEIMNLVGDLRYVHPDDTAAFGGIGARRRAFAADGEIGAWLLSQKVCHLEDRTVFVHAGITPVWARLGCDGINARAARELAEAVPNVSRLEAAVAAAAASKTPLWKALQPYAPASPSVEMTLGLCIVSRRGLLTTAGTFRIGTASRRCSTRATAPCGHATLRCSRRRPRAPCSTSRSPRSAPSAWWWGTPPRHRTRARQASGGCGSGAADGSSSRTRARRAPTMRSGWAATRARRCCGCRGQR